jgi:hypothetical protein
MHSLLQLDQATLANMTAALEYAYRKLPADRDNPPIRKYIAEQIVAKAKTGETATLAQLTDVGLRVVNHYLFPPGRFRLKVFGH